MEVHSPPQTDAAALSTAAAPIELASKAPVIPEVEGLMQPCAILCQLL